MKECAVLGHTGGVGCIRSSVHNSLCVRSRGVVGSNVSMLHLGANGPTAFKFRLPLDVHASLLSNLSGTITCYSPGNVPRTHRTVHRCRVSGKVASVSVSSVCVNGNMDRLIAVTLATFLGSKSRLLVPTPDCSL